MRHSQLCQAYSLNITVVPPGLGYLTAWPTGQAQPYVSTLNSYRRGGGQCRHRARGNGAAAHQHLRQRRDRRDHRYQRLFRRRQVLGALAFYPVTPCRIADTRNPNGAFGGPSLTAGATRNFAVPSRTCGIPATAQAYSLNMTAIPPGPLEYLTAWPAGQTQPYVSTLNALQGQIAANAAIVPAGDERRDQRVRQRTENVIMDINGYFARPAAPARCTSIRDALPRGRYPNPTGPIGRQLGGSTAFSRFRSALRPARNPPKPTR